ncbi:uncharacterized protein [Centroberyx affinis]|uniref:uncharacterized protein n=1 Tax=Centroberyx affinis TaxID=166261 RepID=UPI003A5BAF3F
MSLLLKEIKRLHPAEACQLEREGLRTDSDLQSLTREDLNELFPGKLKLRKNISEIIHRQKPIDVVLKDLKHFIPRESLEAALTENGVLNDYLLILRDLKTQMTNVQTFLDAHIGLLEEYTKNPNQKSDKGFLSDKTNTSSTNPAEGLHTTKTNALLSGTKGVLSGKTNTSSKSPAVGLDTTQTNAHLSGTKGVLSDKTNTSSTNSAAGNCTRPLAHFSQGEEMSGSFSMSSPEAYQGVHAPGLATVTVQSVVCGQTFGSHRTLLDRIKDQSGLKLVESSEYSQDCQIVIVFCPISSRPVSDVEAAMSDIRDDKPVILVMMNHTHNANYATAPRTTWTTIKQDIVLDVNVLYHEMQGLLSCPKNEQAVSHICSKLLNYSSQSSSSDGGNGQGAGAGSVSGSIGHGGGNDWGVGAGSVSSGSIGHGGGNDWDSGAGSVSSGSIGHGGGNDWGVGAGSVSSSSIGHGGGNDWGSRAGSVSSGSIGHGGGNDWGSRAGSVSSGSIGRGGGNDWGSGAGSGGSIGRSSGGNDRGRDVDSGRRVSSKDSRWLSWIRP